MMKAIRTLEVAIVVAAFSALVHGREIGTKVVGQRDNDHYRGTITAYEPINQLCIVTWDNGTIIAYDEITLETLLANYEALDRPIAWQGWYQFFAASSSDFVFDEGMMLLTGANITARSWPPSSECYLDEIRVPLGYFYFHLSGFPDLLKAM